MKRVRAYTHGLNEWVVKVDGVRRGRYSGLHAAYYAARAANKWKRELARGG